MYIVNETLFDKNKPVTETIGVHKFETIARVRAEQHAESLVKTFSSKNPKATFTMKETDKNVFTIFQKNKIVAVCQIVEVPNEEEYEDHF